MVLSVFTRVFLIKLLSKRESLETKSVSFKSELVLTIVQKKNKKFDI